MGCIPLQIRAALGKRQVSDDVSIRSRFVSSSHPHASCVHLYFGEAFDLTEGLNKATITREHIDMKLIFASQSRWWHIVRKVANVMLFRVHEVQGLSFGTSFRVDLVEIATPVYKNRRMIDKMNLQKKREAAPITIRCHAYDNYSAKDKHLSMT